MFSAVIELLFVTDRPKPLATKFPFCRPLLAVEVKMLKNILSQSWRKGAHVLKEGNPPPALYTCWSRFHSGQVTGSQPD